MIRINGLFDNNYNSQYKTLKHLCPEDFSQFEKLRETLKPYSRKKLYELQDQNPNLIIFPADIKDTKDKIHDSVVTVKTSQNLHKEKASNYRMLFSFNHFSTGHEAGTA